MARSMTAHKHRVLELTKCRGTVSVTCSCGWNSELFMVAPETARDRFNAHVSLRADHEHLLADHEEAAGETRFQCTCGARFGWAFATAGTRMKTHRRDVVQSAMESFRQAMISKPIETEESIVAPVYQGPKFDIKKKVDLTIRLALPVRADMIAEAAEALKREFRRTSDVARPDVFVGGDSDGDGIVLSISYP